MWVPPAKSLVNTNKIPLFFPVITSESSIFISLLKVKALGSYLGGNLLIIFS